MDPQAARRRIADSVGKLPAHTQAEQVSLLKQLPFYANAPTTCKLKARQRWQVSIVSLGSKVRDHVNTLCGELLLPKFYDQTMGWLDYNASQEDLRRAETVIKKLRQPPSS
jgi:hypothetical protein